MRLVTSQQPAAKFDRGCERGNYLVAVSLAAQLEALSLIHGLRVPAVIADNEPATYNAADGCWLARWELESPASPTHPRRSRSPRFGAQH